METFTLIAALVGCVSGLTSIIMHLYSFSLTKAKIKLGLGNAHSYVFEADKANLGGRYKTELCAVISLKISNVSSIKVTIDDVKILHGKDRLWHSNDFKFRPPMMKTSESSHTEYPPSPALQIPLQIDAFDTVFYSIRIPFADKFKVYDFDKNELVKLKLVLSTPRNKAVLRVKIPSCDSLHKGVRPQESKSFF